jgi:DNA-binding beta-propeller fold protein YncE
MGYTTSQPLMLPHDTFFGPAAGVATNSKGHVFVYTRNGEPTVSLGGSRAFAHGGSSLYEFAPDGKFIRQIGKQVYGFLAAQQVRVDRNDNIWVVDSYSSMVMKFDPAGRVAMLLGRKPESVDIPSSPDTGRGNPPGSGAQSDLFQSPTDVAWDSAGNIFVADGIGNARVAKFTRDGVFVKSWGSRGAGDSQFKIVHGLAVDAGGNVYVADRGNNRIQVFDNDGNFKSSITTGGNPAAICISPGAHQYLFSSNSNASNDLDHGGEIYKLELNGTVVGKFGQAGKGPRDFGTVTGIDCRNPNALYVGEFGNWRVTKVDLH